MGAKVTATAWVFPGKSGPRGAPVTVKGELGVDITDAKLPVKTPLPVFLMVRFFVTGVAPALAE